MTNEEMQKMMEFILEQQARFTVNIDQLSEKVNQIGEKVNQLSDAQLRTEESISQMARVQTHMNEVVAAIADAQQRTDQKLAETDERLNVLIGVVERYFSNGHKRDS